MLKKLLFCFSIITLTACSGSDDSKSSAFTSTITLNGDAFKPLPNQAVTTIQYNVNGNAANLRKFTMVDNQSRSLVLSIQYPVNQSSVDGEYTFNAINPNNKASLQYGNQSNNMVALSTGTVNVSDLGEGKYRIFFNNVPVTDTQLVVTVVGTAEGTFSE